jgi:tetratricopeptide (TPR) repeat protein
MWVLGYAIAGRKPGSARAAFEEALREDPANQEALYGRGMLLEWQGQEVEALHWYERALAAAADFTPARRARAVVLARRGETLRARREIDLCLKQEESGVTLYAAACIAALSVRDTAGVVAATARDRALAFLKRAFEHGHGRSVARTDPDLKALRQDGRFQRLFQTSPRTP